MNELISIRMNDVEDIVYKEYYKPFLEILFGDESNFVLKENNLRQVLDNDSLSKQQQCQLLKYKEFSVQQIILFFIESSKAGYKFLQKSFKMIPSNYSDEQIPLYATIKENGDVEQLGSSMSDQGVKAFIHNRKRTIIRMAYNENHWHCFIFDYSGLAGRERGKQYNGVCHCHYISDKFGISKGDLLNRLSSFHHPSAAIHLKLSYRNALTSSTTHRTEQ